MDGVERKVNSLAFELKQKPDIASLEIASRTLELLREAVALTKCSTRSEIVECAVPQIKRTFYEAAASSHIVANIVRRITKVIRDESQGEAHRGDVSKLLTEQHSAQAAANERIGKSEDDLCERIDEAISELANELELSPENIVSQALEHVHANECILTTGSSSVVEKFLKKVGEKRRFQAIVTENAPSFSGHKLARNLATTSTIQTTVIPDSAVFAMMARVNKVLLGAHAILADGGLVAPCGAYPVALAARHYSVPVIVCAPLYKLTPRYITPLALLQRGANENDSAAKCDEFVRLLSPEELLNSADPAADSLLVKNPAFDYVPSEFVSLFVSNVGGTSPNYLYRLLHEYYHPDDYDVSLWR